MELLYNPDRMPEEEIKATFVAREALVDTLVELVKGQPDGAGVQHAVIIAPRGMGKTTVLLMVKFAIKDRGLADQWQAVKFPEESYGIYDLADLWVETLYLIAADTADTELRRLAETLKTKYPNNDELQEAAYAALKDWRRKHGRRLLLLVENFDQILEQINDERDNARLRDVMMNDGTLMLLGGATTFFKEARAYDQPLYNFFKIYNLHDLKFAQMQELLSRRATVDRVADFETSLRQNEGRLRVLEYFTGGSPRLVLMLYRVVTQSDVDEVRRALEKLLDEVTPYYKAKIEMLPPQQRKILDHIARVSGQTNEGLTPKEIAEAVRLPQNQVSAQLKRLSELDYVRAANLRGRSSFYTLSEPLYAIWHQMRFGRNVRERMNWLVSFLKVWYAAEEMGTESERLDRRFRAEIGANHPQKARDLLEHHRYLAEAISDEQVRARALEWIICGHLELKDIKTVKGDLLTGVNLADLTDETIKSLLAAGCVSNEQLAQAKSLKSASVSDPKDEEFAKAIAAASIDYEKARYEDALQYIDWALRIKPDSEIAWYNRGVVLANIGQHKEALSSYDRALDIRSDFDAAWYNRGIVSEELGQYEDALGSYDKALEINPNDYNSWQNRGHILGLLNRHQESLESFEQALRINFDFSEAWYSRGVALRNLGRYEEAVASYDRSIEINPQDAMIWNNRGIAQEIQGNQEGALGSFNQALQIDPNNEVALYNLGILLGTLGRTEDALAIFDQLVRINPDNDLAWYNYGVAHTNLGHYEDAVTSYDRTLSISPKLLDAWRNRGNALSALGRYDDALASYARVLEVDPNDGVTWYNRSIVCLIMFVELIRQEKFDEAKQKWNEGLEFGSRSKNEDWPNRMAAALLEVARADHLKFVRQLLTEARMEERLFPLARAIDYLQTGNEALIEKLSPEVRGIVEEVVAKLRTKTASV